MYFIEGVGRVTGQHSEIRSKLLNQGFDDAVSVGRVRDSDTFGGHFLLQFFGVVLEIEPHDPFEFEVLREMGGQDWEREEEGGREECTEREGRGGDRKWREGLGCEK